MTSKPDPDPDTANLSDSTYTSSGLSLPDHDPEKPPSLSPPPTEKHPSPAVTTTATATVTNAPPIPPTTPRPSSSCSVPPTLTDTNEEDDDTFPEGGLQAWLVVLGSFSAMLSLFGLINSAAVFESYFASHQLADRSASEIGWIFSLYLFIVFFVGIQVGPVFDRFGARWLVGVGGGLIFVSLLVLGWCEGMLTFSSSLLGGVFGLVRGRKVERELMMMQSITRLS